MSSSPAALNNDLTAEILLRVGPDEPARLFRVSIVCKLWHRILSDPGFRRRYITFHRCSPPLLGFFYNVDSPGPFSRFVTTTGAGSSLPTAAASTLPEFNDRHVSWTLDCRHGRVLFKKADNRGLVVWDPVADIWTDLPPPGICYESYCAVVLCDVDGCDHRDCRGGRFLVVCVGSDVRYRNVYACVYSSDERAWQAPVSDGKKCYSFDVKRPALIGDGIYWTSEGGCWIMKYDLVERCFSARIGTPNYRRGSVLMQNDDGSLGFAGIKRSTLYLWSTRWNDAVNGGIEKWVQRGVIKLREMLPVDDKPFIKAKVIGFAEGVGVFFISTNIGVFAVELKSSGRVMKVSKPSNNYRTAFPFISLFTPDRCLRQYSIGCGDELVTK